jgi:spermidine/putrescine transport system substrate-binding protein
MIDNKEKESVLPVSPRSGARLTRRRLLKSVAAAGTVAAMGPWIVRDAFSSSGTLNIMIWSDYLPKSFVARFEKATGIKVRHTPYDSNEELFNKLQASKGRNYDLVSPTSYRLLQWKPLGLLQPWDMSKIPVKQIDPAMFNASMTSATWNGQTYLLPFVWGTEGLAWNTERWSQTYQKLSYGDLWLPEMRGQIMGRPHSVMTSIGLYLSKTGAVPSNRMLDAYKDEATMRRIWNEIGKFAVKRKTWFKTFWNDAEAQVNGFTQNAVVLGQVWDGPTTRLKRRGFPIAFMAPQEGALGWIDGFSLPVGAENVAQAYEFVKFAVNARNAALFSNETGYDTVVAGVDRFLNKVVKAKMADSYPDNAVANIWWWPPEPVWYTALRDAFTDQFVAA